MGQSGKTLILGGGITVRVTIASMSEALKNERLDAQFFDPFYVKSSRTILARNNQALSSIAHISDGNHLKIAEAFDRQDGVRYLRGQDLSEDMLLHDRNIVYISENLFSGLKRSHIKASDVLVTIVGANTGLVGLVYDPPDKLVASCKLGIVRGHDIPPGYLYAFLSGKYGQHQLRRSIRGGGQTGLILPDLRRVRIARFESRFESNVQQCVRIGHAAIIESKAVFEHTQQDLLSALGLANWQPRHALSFTGNYSETQAAERIDAEYFQPKYAELVNAIRQYPCGCDHLGNLVSIKKCVEVGSEAYVESGIPFIRVSNLSPFETTQEKYISESLYDMLRKHQPEKGEILLTKDATPGIAHHLRETPPRMIPSGGILRLRIRDKRMNPDYLTLVLNSLLVKEQINRDVGGSVILHWRLEQVKATVIPLLPIKEQERIAEKVSEAFRLRQKSKHLLDAARRAVEIAIEQDELTARKWLDAEMETAG